MCPQSQRPEAVREGLANHSHCAVIRSDNMPASIYVVSAIGGNMWRESHVNPALWENLTPGSPGYGLCQWTNERRIALFRYLNGRGLPNSDGDGQCDYLVVENDWIDTSASPLHYPNLQAFLNTDNQNIPYLTETFMRCWERPGYSHGAEDRRKPFVRTERVHPGQERQAVPSTS